VTILAALAAGFYVTPRESKYTAEARLYVGSRSVDIDPTSLDISNDRFAGLSFLANSYATMLNTRTAAQQAIAESGVALTVTQAQNAITASAEPGSLLITLAVVHSEPEVARSLANGLADSFVTLLQDQESQLALPADKDVPAPVSVFEYAVLPTAPQPSDLVKNLMLAAVFGLLAGIGWVVLLEYLDLTIRSADDAQHRLQLPALGAIPLDSRLVRG
jgi:polysaccharide biosynthesis transport protein